MQQIERELSQAVILIGHGSLRSASGASMIRLAARLRDNGVAEIVEPAFLNFSRPTLAEAVARCRAAGATRLTIQPYFLIEGAYVRHDLRELIAHTMETQPDLPVWIAPAFGHHPAMVELALQRITEALPAGAPDSTSTGNVWGLLLMAHGTPLAEANAPLYEIVDDLRQATGVACAQAAFLDCNTPNILGGIRQLAEAGVTHLITLPYFLHMGRHVREDLPQLLAEATMELPSVIFFNAQHLDYDLRLVQVITDRLAQTERI